METFRKLRARVTLEAPPSSKDKVPCERVLSRALQLDLRGVRTLLERYPTTLPVALPSPEAARLVETLNREGLRSTFYEPADELPPACKTHDRFVASGHCRQCSDPLCLICERQGDGTCLLCQARERKRKLCTRVRLSFLLVALFGVSLLGVKEWRRRNLGWDRPQRVAVVLLRPADSALSPKLVESFAERVPFVEDSLFRQRTRYKVVAPPPIDLTVFGPVPEVGSVPELGEPSLWELLRFNLELMGYARSQDRSAQVNSRLFDVRIYVRVTESDRHLQSAEGLGQKAGTIGVVSTEISEQGIDFAWFVTIHEYLHTRGASDKYDHTGRALYPQGLAAPQLSPLFPQPGTEMMARGRPITRAMEDLPGSPDTWFVGKWTAEEIGWIPR